MLKLIVGPGGVGKNTVVDVLVNDYGYKFLCTDTTRPMRPGELNGVTYNFRSDEEFSRRESDGLYVETAYYNTVNANGEPLIWKYGTPKDTFEKSANDAGEFVSIVTPVGATAIKQAGIPACVIYLTANNDVIMSRMGNREPLEAARRIKADREVFKDIKCDYCIDTSFLTPKSVADIISDMISLSAIS